MSLFATSRALTKLTNRVDDLEDACANLERDARKLNLEFTDLYDKVSHQMGRMAKRFATRSKVDALETEPESPDMFLNHVDPISAKILARRNRAENGQ